MLHAFMNGLVPFSGLTEDAASRFMSNKDLKTNWRLFGQIASSCVRKITDSLYYYTSQVSCHQEKYLHFRSVLDQSRYKISWMT